MYSKPHHFQTKSVIPRLLLWGRGGQGALNLPFPIPFNPSSRPVFVGSCLFAFFQLQNIAQCSIIFPYFSRFPPPWESCFLSPLLPPPIQLPPPFLPLSCPLSLSTLFRAKIYILHPHQKAKHNIYQAEMTKNNILLISLW